MPKDLLPMHKIEAVLELHHTQHLSSRQIAAAVQLSKSTVNDYLKRAAAAGVPWPLPENWDENDLYAALFGSRTQACPARALPNWSYIHVELRKKGVTLQLLHEEYLQEHPDGYRYSQFCHRYRSFHKKLNVCMRQQHRAGEKLFVDFAGQTVPITDLAGETREAQIFIAVLGASNYTYAEAVGSQSSIDWIHVHSNALAFFGGSPSLTICDNLKAAVTRPCRYEPLLNETYEDWARHYGTCVLPARVARPKDKGYVAYCTSSVV